LSDASPSTSGGTRVREDVKLRSFSVNRRLEQGVLQPKASSTSPLDAHNEGGQTLADAYDGLANGQWAGAFGSLTAALKEERNTRMLILDQSLVVGKYAACLNFYRTVRYRV
jgi:hypothetical protein